MCFCLLAKSKIPLFGKISRLLSHLMCLLECSVFRAAFNSNSNHIAYVHGYRNRSYGKFQSWQHQARFLFECSPQLCNRSTHTHSHTHAHTYELRIAIPTIVQYGWAARRVYACDRVRDRYNCSAYTNAWFANDPEQLCMYAYIE